MVFSTNSDLFYTYLQYKSKKSHGPFGLGWKYQVQTVQSDIVYFSYFTSGPLKKVKKICLHDFLKVLLKKSKSSLKKQGKEKDSSKIINWFPTDRGHSGGNQFDSLTNFKIYYALQNISYLNC